MHADSSIHWKAIFMQAVDESDREKQRGLVREAEAAIYLRLEQLADSAETHDELSTMSVATKALGSIRVTLLGGTQLAGGRRG